MKKFIQLHYDSHEEIVPLEVSILTTDSISLSLKELLPDSAFHYIEITHHNLNTLLDFSFTRDFQILYFNDDNTFGGSSYAISTSVFSIQTQYKAIVLIAIEHTTNFNHPSNIEKLTHFKLNNYV